MPISKHGKLAGTPEAAAVVPAVGSEPVTNYHADALGETHVSPNFAFNGGRLGSGVAVGLNSCSGPQPDSPKLIA